MRDPINPADIRVGDRVERVYTTDTCDVIHRFDVLKRDAGGFFGGDMWWYEDVDEGEWFLLDHPDPWAEVVEEIAEVRWVASHDYLLWDDANTTQKDQYRNAVRGLVRDIAERWELVEKNG